MGKPACGDVTPVLGVHLRKSEPLNLCIAKALSTPVCQAHPYPGNFAELLTVLSDLLHLLKGFHCCPAKGDLSVCKDRL